MRRYRTTSISGTANTRTTETLLTGIGGRHRNVVGVMFAETTGTKQNDANLELWLEQDQVMSLSVEQMLDGADSPLRLPNQLIPVERELNEGEELVGGFTSGSTASNFDVTVVYTEE